MGDGLSRRGFLQLGKVAGGLYLGNMLRGTKYFSKGDSENKVALTFDDGWEEEPVEEILDVLKDYNIKTSFFVVGKMLPIYKDTWHRALEDGHDIYNHTQTHPYIGDNTSDWTKEILGWEESYEELGRGSTDKVLRLPYNYHGDNGSGMFNWLSSQNYEAVVAWSVLSADFYYKDPNESNIEQIIKNSEMQGGDIVLYHFLPSTAKALPQIIENSYEKGLEFVKLKDLPGTPIYEPKTDQSAFLEKLERYGLR